MASASDAVLHVVDRFEVRDKAPGVRSSLYRAAACFWSRLLLVSSEGMPFLTWLLLGHSYGIPQLQGAFWPFGMCKHGALPFCSVMMRSPCKVHSCSSPIAQTLDCSPTPHWPYAFAPCMLKSNCLLGGSLHHCIVICSHHCRSYAPSTSSGHGLCLFALASGGLMYMALKLI